MSMECQCIQGVTLHSLEPIISTGTELVSVTAGPLPCHIEYMEVFTVTTKLRVLKTGRLLLGFVQMLLSPGSSTQRIASGFSLPEIEVESSTLELTVKYPPTATVGSHFTMTCEIVNKTAALQSCQFTMEKSNAVGLISGAENWNVSIGPHAACETSIVLRPLTTGVLHLPSVSLKHSSGGSYGSVAACQFHSQKICVLPL
uniref:WGS project CAEQ00000000 data, annotated contig 1891 n=1 Tax=Trypanosoma congolense (strain IL3000) TaxID=1068625 RepID=F9W9S4_TRYCI|nr:unnamed protein product [Trypanosoma congolense IL3000]